MYIEENGWMLELIFDLSSQALIQMINQLFHTAYSDEEKIWKEWQRANSIGLKVGETNRYEFQVRRLDGCTQIYAEDRGSVFAWGRSVRRSVVHIREPQIIYFGKNHQEEYSTTLEFPDKARVTLPTRIITMENYSPLRLEECGLILFLPFLLEGYIENMKEDNWDGLRYFLMDEMREALRRAYGKGSLTAVDMQKLKQICRKKVWKSYGNKKWMQDLGMQTFMLDALDTDFSLIEHPTNKEEQIEPVRKRPVLSVFIILQYVPVPGSEWFPHVRQPENSRQSCRPGGILPDGAALRHVAGEKWSLGS